MIKLKPKSIDWHIPEGSVLERIIYCEKCNNAYVIEPGEDHIKIKCECFKKPEIKYTKQDVEFWKAGKALYDLAAIIYKRKGK